MWRRAAILLVALVVLGALFAWRPHRTDVEAPDEGLRLGVAAATDGNPADLGAIAGAGLGWLREDVRWDRIERVRGRYVWTVYDRLFAQAARDRLHVLPILDSSPPWLTPDRWTLPPDDAAWSRFVAAVVGRYGEGGTFWAAHPDLDDHYAARWYEVWNEPYYTSFSTGGPDPARYARLVQLAATAARRVQPDAHLLMEAVEAYTATDGTARSWLADAAAGVTDLAGSVDALAVHPYTEGDPGQGQGATALPRIDAVLAAADLAGLANKPLWITEIGWSTCAKRPPCVTEEEQARDLGATLQAVRQSYARRVRAVIVYRLRDYLGRDEDDPLAGFGLLRPDGSATPAWGVLKAAAAAVRR